jgi:LysR family transcriptional activator of nhaA
MNTWLNYHHLLYFKTIAEEGTISRAAIRLRVGQPTLSAQLKQLEEQLGVLLFERKNKRLVLTEHGKIALDYAKSIFKTGSEMLEAIQDRAKPTKPSLHIGALDSIPKQVVLKMVDFALRARSCQITLSEGKPDELLRDLIAHRVDLLITNFSPAGTDSRGIRIRSISKRNIAIYGAPRLKHLKKGFPKSVSGQPMIVPTYDSKLRPDLEHWADTQRVELDILIETQDIALKKLLATQGLGLAALATHAVRSQVARGGLIEIGRLQGVHEELFLLSANRKIANPVSEHLFKFFKL